MEIDINIAKRVGLNCAIVYAVIKQGIEDRGVSFEGHPFIQISAHDIHKEVDFISERTIVRALKILEENSLIESKFFVGHKKWRRCI